MWDHIEVSVHPFDLRVEQSTYERVTAYLFREKDTKLDGGGAESDPSLGRSLPSAASGPSEPPEASRERAREAMLLGTKKKPSPSPREHPTKPPREPASRLATRAGRPAPLRVPGAAETAAAVGSFPEHSARTATLPGGVPGVAKKTVVVRYVRVNDVRLRVSYDGKPRAFHEVRLFLDAFTHHGFRGRWRELVDKIKGGFAWSALKSVAGLQPRSAKRVHKGAHHPADKGRLPPPRGAARPGPDPTRTRTRAGGLRVLRRRRRSRPGVVISRRRCLRPPAAAAAASGLVRVRAPRVRRGAGRAGLAHRRGDGRRERRARRPRGGAAPPRRTELEEQRE